MNQSLTTVFNVKIGESKCVPRIWMEGENLTRAGLKIDTRYRVLTTTEHRIELHEAAADYKGETFKVSSRNRHGVQRPQMIVLGWLWLAVVGGKQSLIAMISIAALIEGGNAFVMMPAVTLGANSLPDQLISHGTAVITTVRQILGSTGVAVATLILATVTAGQLKVTSAATANLAGYHAVFWTFLGVAVVGWIFAAMLRDGRKQA